MTGQSMQRVPPQLPLEMQELASTYQLGVPVAKYTAGITRQTIIQAIIWIIVLGIVSYWASATGHAIASYVAGGLMLLGLVYGLGRGIMKRAWWVYVFNHGFVFAKGGQPAIFRWEGVRAIWRQEAAQPRGSGGYSISHKYTIDRLDGYRLVLDDDINKVKELGDLLDKQVTNAMWPRALAAYSAGQTIPFGPLSVSRQGMSNGKELLPWTAVKEIEVRRGDVRIHRGGGNRDEWEKVAIADIANCSLFLTLTRFALGK